MAMDVSLTGEHAGSNCVGLVQKPAAVRGILGLVLMVVSACGGNTKDRTNDKTNSEGDASADAGPGAATDESPLDASQLADAAGSDAGSASGTSASLSSSGATSSVLTSGITTTTSGSGTSTATTTATTTSGLPPGWVEIEPVAEGLDDCIAKSNPGETTCSTRVECGLTAISANCSLGDGVWTCQCKNGGLPQRDYTLTGVDASSACDVSIPICAPTRPDDPEPECSFENTGTSNTNCSASELCRTAIELSDDVTAVVVESEPYVACESYDDVVMCTCWASSEQARVFEQGLEQACVSVAPFCKDGFPAPDDESDELCPNNSNSQGQDYCTIDRLCGWRMELDDAYLVYDQRVRNVACNATGCDCNSEIYVHAKATGDIAGEQCEVMEEFCYGGITAVPSGEVAVRSVGTQGAEAECTGNAEAAQWVTWGDDRAVELVSVVSTSCSRVENDTWSCSCQSGEMYDTEAFEVEGQNYDDTCSTALDDCVARARIVPSDNPNVTGYWFEFLPLVPEADAGE